MSEPSFNQKVIERIGNKHEQQGARIARLEKKGLGAWLQKHKSMTAADLFATTRGFDGINAILKEFEMRGAQ